MKKWKLFACLLMAVCLLGSTAAPALAADSGREQYTYRVRLFENGQVIFEEYRNYGQQITLGGYTQGTEVPGTPYYYKGVRVAGQDSGVYDADTVPATFNVTQDIDYVVAYGLRGNMVAYTVNYVDEDGNPVTPNDGRGNPLPSSETFYGSVGDRIIVSYRQVEGYEPQAYNLAKTLSEDPGENVFTFVYREILAPEEEEPEEEEPEEEEPEEEPEGDDADIGDEDVPLDNGPRDLVDLDEDETPLGIIDMGQEAVENGAEFLRELPFGARIGLIGLDLLVLWLIFWAIVTRKRRKKDQAD